MIAQNGALLVSILGISILGSVNVQELYLALEEITSNSLHAIMIKR